MRYIDWLFKLAVTALIASSLYKISGSWDTVALGLMIFLARIGLQRDIQELTKKEGKVMKKVQYKSNPRIN